VREAVFPKSFSVATAENIGCRLSSRRRKLPLARRIRDVLSGETVAQLSAGPTPGQLTLARLTLARLRLARLTKTKEQDGMLKRILLGLGDKEHSEAKIRLALDLAAAHGAKIRGVTVLDVDRLNYVGPVPMGGSGAAEELREHRLRVAAEKLSEVAEYFEQACRDAGVEFELHREEGEPQAILTEHAKFQDLMLFGLTGVFDYGLITDRAEHPIDMLIRFIQAGVRPILAVNDTYRKIERVLIAYSGSVESARTVKQFIRMQALPNPVIRVVTFDTDDEAGARRLRDVEGYCADYGVEVETKFIHGPPKGHILEEADAFNADAIVMGNSAKRLLSRKIFGETALYCLQHADRPVFLNQ